VNQLSAIGAVRFHGSTAPILVRIDVEGVQRWRGLPLLEKKTARNGLGIRYGPSVTMLAGFRLALVAYYATAKP